MENISTSKKIVNQQQASVSWLQELHPLLRFILGLFACAAFAWYGPSLLITLTTGMWSGGLNMWAANVIGISILILINLIGNKLDRLLLTGAACALLLGIYEISFVMRLMTLDMWRTWLPQILVPPIILLLNSYLLNRYKEVAGLL